MATAAKKSLVQRIKALSPQDFENLTYDLLFASGLRNLRWRTPGADGGRDLEGEYSHQDLSGETAIEKWYIECKRYDKSLNWPTVREKVAVAENHKAHYLLFVTTANFSAACRDEVDRYNLQGKVRLRIWPFYSLDQLLNIHSDLLVKYGLSESKQKIQHFFTSIITEITKLSQSAYAAITFGVDASARIELLAGLTELLTTRTNDVEVYGKFVVRKFRPQRDSFDWCIPNPLLVTEFDGPGLRAALVAIKVTTAAATLDCKVKEKELIVSGIVKVDNFRLSRISEIISIFGLVDFQYEPKQIRIVSRQDEHS